jgi:hypothetical protein
VNRERSERKLFLQTPMATPPRPNSRGEPTLCTLLLEPKRRTVDQTADIPKNARFAFGRRVDYAALDALPVAVRVVCSPAGQARQAALDMFLEQLRVLRRLVVQRCWISQPQLPQMQDRLDEAGKMLGGWMRKGEGK